MARAGRMRGVASTAAGPWFLFRPRAALAVAAVMYASVLALRLLLTDPLDAISMLYLFPVALVAMTKGRWGGLAGGALGVALIDVWVLVDVVDLSVIGWLSRALPLLLIGLLIGDARDRLVRTVDERAAHEVTVQRQREAIEINDTLVQGMSAAKWSIEAGRTEAGLQVLGETVELGHRLVSELIRDSGAGASVVRLDGSRRRAPAEGSSAEGTKVPPLDDARP